MASELSLTDVSTAVRSEYRRIFTERRDDLIAVGFNAGLVTICWFLLPDSIRNWLFTLHGALAFPFVLEMWMLGDTPATNVAGRDAVRAVSQMQEWVAWFGTLGNSVVDMGNAFGASSTVTNGSASDGGASKLGGYSIITAESLGEATKKADGCPVLRSGGSVEVYEALPM